jgi:hypothetical protein
VSLLILVVDDKCDVEMLFRQQMKSTAASQGPRDRRLKILGLMSGRGQSRKNSVCTNVFRVKIAAEGDDARGSRTFARSIGCGANRYNA